MKNFLLVFVAAIALQPVMSQINIHAGRDADWQQLYRASPTRINNLVHTKLDVRFDYDNSYLNGKVWITLQPHFYATDSLALDAKGMDIKKVTLEVNKQSLPLKYKYDGQVLNIKLDKTYKAGQKYTVFIDYTAKPNELTVKGSAAITDAKGLYFINPKGEIKDKPTQIWTQGETEATSVWCPTIDNPSQKTTNEIFMTVPDKYVTLSNGKLVSQKKNSDNTRTDYWKMDQPHAPYLFFMGVGDYAIVKDTYKGKEVNYYVEKEYAPVAKKIFGNTPEMLGFFARITGIEYPWIKYSQIVGRDYVSGAMENTTATLHQESAQQDARQLIDGNAWEPVIAHEAFHHWFGDYVTAESWSQLTVNESFANYSEVLWEEYKYGKDAGAEHSFDDMQGYLSSESANKDLVRHYYKDKEDMFDAVSYNKGGRILHMLRNYLGDSAFNKAMGLYLSTNQFKTGEAHQFRLAVEEVSGRDLNWFFNQWFFGSGHPNLDISYGYDDNKKTVKVTIKQVQAGDKVFELPIAIDIYNGAQKQRYNVVVKEKEQSFDFAYTSRPDLVNVDGDKMLLCEKTDHKTLENYIHQYKYAGNYLDRREAIDVFAVNQADPVALEMLKLAFKDTYHGLRKYALEKADLKNPVIKKALEPVIAEIARNDKKSTVRGAAIELLIAYNNSEYKSLFQSAINDSSYSVAGAGLIGLWSIDEAAALTETQRIKNQPAKGKLAVAIVQLLIRSGNPDDFEIVARNFEGLPLGEEKFQSLQPFAQYVGRMTNTEKFKKGIDLIAAVRDGIPAAYREQVATFVNTILFTGITAEKKKLLNGEGAQAAQEQIEYVKLKTK